MFLNPWNFYYHSVTSAVNRNRFETTNRDFIKFLKKKKKKKIRNLKTSYPRFIPRERYGTTKKKVVRTHSHQTNVEASSGVVCSLKVSSDMKRAGMDTDASARTQTPCHYLRNFIYPRVTSLMRDRHEEQAAKNRFGWESVGVQSVCTPDKTDIHLPRNSHNCFDQTFANRVANRLKNPSDTAFTVIAG